MNRYTHPAHSNIHDGHSSNHARPATVPHTGAFPVFSRWFFRWFPASKVKIATCFKKVVVKKWWSKSWIKEDPMNTNPCRQTTPKNVVQCSQGPVATVPSMHWGKKRCN